MLRQFQCLTDQIQRVEEYIEEESQQVLSDHPSLLMIHYQVFQLEGFRTATMYHARHSSMDVINTLNNYFQRIVDLSESFDDYVWKLAANTVTLIKEGYGSVIVRLVKIIEMEEHADSEAISVEFKEEDLITSFEPRKIKAYRIKYFDILREEIGKTFMELYDQHRTQVDRFLGGIDQLLDNLETVSDELVPCFPRRYNIFQFFVLEHHRTIYDYLTRMVSFRLDGGAILFILKWVREYYGKMSGKMGVGEELLEPRLLDGKEEEMVTSYVTMARNQLNEWMKNLLNRETTEFLSRTKPPEVDEHGRYVVAGSVIVYQMFNQQVDVVSQSRKSSLLAEIVNECIDRLADYQKSWNTVLGSEMKRFEAKEKDFAPGLTEYVIALANDAYRSTEFNEQFLNRLETLCEEAYLEPLKARIQETSDMFINISKRCYTALCDIVIQDLKPATSQLFCPSWYEQDLIRLITGTLEDYCSDFTLFLTEYLLSKLTNDLFDRVVLVYLDAFRFKQAKFHMPVASDKIKSEVKQLTDFFLKFKKEKRVQQGLDPIIKVVAVLDSNARMAFMDFYTLWKAYPDIPIGFVEDVLSKRDDLEKSQVKEIMENIKAKLKEDPRVPTQPSIFSKLSG
jgi:exocyst complex component 3